MVRLEALGLIHRQWAGVPVTVGTLWVHTGGCVQAVGDSQEGSGHLQITQASGGLSVMLQ